MRQDIELVGNLLLINLKINLKMVIIANRKFIEDVIKLHEMGKDTEQILFSLGLPYEEPEDFKN